jgi:hypothetical protein
LGDPDAGGREWQSDQDAQRHGQKRVGKNHSHNLAACRAERQSNAKLRYRGV